MSSRQMVLTLGWLIEGDLFDIFRQPQQAFAIMGSISFIQILIILQKIQVLVLNIQPQIQAHYTLPK